MPHPPMLAIVGRKHSGKTTLVVRLAAALGRRGHRVMIIKHGSHTFNIDPSTTDTYRHYHEGGAAKVAMVAPDKFALIERHAAEPSPYEIAGRHMADAGLVLCEGFKRTALPRIEIFRRAAHAEPLYDSSSDTAPLYRGIVTDDAAFQAPLPLFHLDDSAWLDRLATHVESMLSSLQ